MNEYFEYSRHSMHETLHVYVCICTSPKSNIFSLAVLSADRVEQMTKTYNDMEVVTQLLAEVGVLSLVTFDSFNKKQCLIG